MWTSTDKLNGFRAKGADRTCQEPREAVKKGLRHAKQILSRAWNGHDKHFEGAVSFESGLGCRHSLHGLRTGL